MWIGCNSFRHRCKVLGHCTKPVRGGRAAQPFLSAICLGGTPPSAAACATLRRFEFHSLRPSFRIRLQWTTGIGSCSICDRIRARRPTDTGRASAFPSSRHARFCNRCHQCSSRNRAACPCRLDRRAVCFRHTPTMSKTLAAAIVSNAETPATRCGGRPSRRFAEPVRRTAPACQAQGPSPRGYS